MMKKNHAAKRAWRVLALALCLAMLVGLLPTVALAAATDVSLSNPKFYSNGALKSIDVSFYFGGASATGQLALMTKELTPRTSGYGDYTNFGNYARKFDTFNDVLKEDNANKTFGIISYSGSFSVSGNKTVTFQFGENDIPMSKNQTYFLNLWTKWSTYGCYPDNLLCAIRVQDGEVRYTKGLDDCTYNKDDLNIINRTDTYNVTVTKGTNMTKTSDSGAERQNNVVSGITPVVYTADNGYYFPESYSVATVNGIMVRRDSNKQVTVYGTPSANANITLAAATEEPRSADQVLVNGQTLSQTTPYLASNGTAASATQPSTGGYAYFDAVNGILELHNFELDGGSIKPSATNYDKTDLTIKLVGTNKLTDVNKRLSVGLITTDNTFSSKYIDVTITGPGSLYAENDSSYTTVYVKNGDITVKDGANVTLKHNGGQGETVHAVNGSINISGTGTTLNAVNAGGYGVRTTSGVTVDNKAKVYISGASAALVGGALTATLANVQVSKDGTTFAQASALPDALSHKYVKINGAPTKTQEVTWDANEGTFSGVPAKSEVLTYGTTITAPTTNPTREGYDFKGWTAVKDGATLITDFGTVANDVTYYAKWEAAQVTTHTITWDANGGTLTGNYTTGSVDYGTQIVAPTASKAADAQYTYTFDGWYTTAENGTKVTDFGTVTENVTYYAHWTQTVNQYTVSWDANGSNALTGNYTTGSVDYGTTIIAPNDPTREDAGYTYEFLGWYTDKDFEYDKLEANTAVTSNVTYYAHWKRTAKNFTVELKANGGTITNGKDVTGYTYGTNVLLPSANYITKNGYSFAGWYATSNFSGDRFDKISATDSGNRTFYAKWNTIDYSITYDLNGGALPENAKNPGIYTIETTGVKLTNPTREGYTFAGWTGDYLTGATIDVTINGSDGINNRKYTATWTADTYTVTLETNGGTIADGKDVTSYTCGVGATLPTVDNMTYTGHTFKGWYEDSIFSGSPVMEISTTATGAKTYYAKWLSTDAGITAVSVDNTAGTINGTTITVVLPYGTTTLPTENSKVSITAADGATVSGLTTTDGSEWTFTVTAADGQTTAGYTVSVSIAPDPATGNRNDIAAAKSTVENHDWTVPQATANTEEAVKTWIEGQLAAMNLNGASYTVTMTGFMTATEGTAADRDGTNGSFTFTVKLYKGNDTGNTATSTYAEATATISNGTVTATPYTKWAVTVNAGNGGSVSGGGTFEENTQVTVTATPNSGYHFVRWTENGAEVSTSASYTFTLTADRTLTAVFSRNSSGGYSYYTIKATAGAGGFISPSGNVSVREGRDQTFTITPDKGYAVANVKIDGKSIGAVKSYTFENVRRTHTIEVIFMKANGNPQTGVFVDVATGSYYEDAVDWAVENGITNGVSSNMFAPDDPCTRAQIVTFLWRAAGSPAPKSMSSFTDVPADAFYAKAVAWAVENGITSGTGEGKFSPNAICTRAQSVTFLYRASGSPAVSGSAEFSDVSTTAFYADAVAWAAKKGITTGIDGGLFGSDNDCTRSQIVTFLWRCKK